MTGMADASDNRRPTARSQEGRKHAMPLPALVALAAALVVVLVLFGQFCSAAATIDITINGNPLTLHGTKTLGSAIRKSGLPVNPGDLISLRGSVLERSAGDPFYATVNGEEEADPDRTLNTGDEIVVSDGKDVVEDYDSVEESHPYGAIVAGAGAICTFEPGQEGIVEHLTGRLSGEEVKRVKQEGKDAVATWHAPDVGGDKVLALTFDEGPSDFTPEILDVLAENDVQATFFCKGSEVGENIDLVKREWSTYNQVASNTYSRNVTENTTAEQLLDEVRRGFGAVDEALEGEPVKRVVRFPEALLTRSMAAVIDGEVDAVIGWNLDTGDWLGYNSDEVYEVLMSAEPGDIVLLHDGGEDCSGTAAALRRALPELKKQGFSFVTVERLMMYPAKEYD